MIEETCQDQTGVFRRMLKNEIVVAVGILTVAFSLFNIYKQSSDRTLIIENKLEYMEKNHLTHIEAEITEIRKMQGDLNTAGMERDKKLERLLTILEEHEKTAQQNISR